MQARPLLRDVVPLLLAFAALAAAALLLDAALHLLRADWIGRYMGIPGALLILTSFGYSLRKRKLIRFGRPVPLLRWHEGMAWAGSLLVLAHAGTHFNGMLAWLAAGAMLINVASGLTGKFLLDRARRRVDEARQRPREQGPPAEDLQERTYWDGLALDVVKQWRTVHLPITLVFAVLASAHIVAELLFWAWK
jgi:hypothetical protein